MLQVYAHLVKNGYAHSTHSFPGSHSIMFRFKSGEVKLSEAKYNKMYVVSKTILIKALYARD